MTQMGQRSHTPKKLGQGQPSQHHDTLHIQEYNTSLYVDVLPVQV